ncbi:MAG TPA: hypothetical protein ENG69_05625 [Candidatus Korarchaeota archaeon]|nr:hypothetical protein [Candidatus Korarchaeota archaeon]
MQNEPFPAIAKAKQGTIVILRLVLDPEKPPISEIASKLESLGSRIVGGIHGEVDDSHLWTLLLEVPPNVDGDAVVEEMASIDGVRSVEKHGVKVGDFWLNDALSGVGLLGARAGVLPIATARALFGAVKRYWGPAGEAFLYHMGVAAGKESYQELQSKVQMSELDLLTSFLGLIKASGWINWFEVVEFNQSEGRALIRVKGSFECAESRGAEGKRSNILRGLLAGFVGAMWGIPTVGEELKCEAIGDPYDEILIRAMKL